jgi:hypothetical protein
VFFLKIDNNTQWIGCYNRCFKTSDKWATVSKATLSTAYDFLAGVKQGNWFAAVSTSYTIPIYNSADGINWSSGYTQNSTERYGVIIPRANGQLVIVGADSSGGHYRNCALVADNANQTWTKKIIFDAGTDLAQRPVIWGGFEAGGTVWVLGYRSNAAYTHVFSSTDLDTWTDHGAYSPNNSFSSDYPVIPTSDGGAVVNYGETQIYKSSAAPFTTWSLVANPGHNCGLIWKGPGQTLYAKNRNGTWVYFSVDDGATWTQGPQMSDTTGILDLDANQVPYE